MTYTTKDLREVLRRESGYSPNPDRLRQIEVRITRRKRRRLGASVVGVAVAAAASTVALWPSEPEPPVRPASTPLREVSLSWPGAKTREVEVPVGEGALSVRGRCATNDAMRRSLVVVTINGVHSAALPCTIGESRPTKLGFVPPGVRSVRVRFEISDDLESSHRTDWRLTVFADAEPAPEAKAPKYPGYPYRIGNSRRVADVSGVWPRDRVATLTVPYRGRKLRVARICAAAAGDRVAIGLFTGERSVAAPDCQVWRPAMAPLAAVEVDPQPKEANFTLRMAVAGQSPGSERALVTWTVAVYEDK
ncbi:hypothetical protein [Spirillospora sp. CA-294931]|uniref:hypothetical protein n=1 Tax=Spirillospora sp. CA-294931 TaxID=3240042 RepID=UPI003D900F72